MLHIALKLAQQLQDKDGITYVFDQMANLAYEVGNYEKAEKLFVTVMQRLIGDGVKEDDIRMIHMSSKLAQMAALQDHMDKAFQGFEWCLKKIEKNLEFQENSELYELWGLIKNQYAQALMQVGKYPEAKAAFLDAYEVFKKFRDDVSDEGIQLLNNLGVACTELNELDLAEDFLKRAVDMTTKIPDFADQGIYQANLGLVYLKKGMLERAKQFCKYAYNLGMKHDSKDSVAQASYCLDQIKKAIQEAEH
jgi:tetratricopeptide repeat protein 19